MIDNVRTPLSLYKTNALSYPKVSVSSPHLCYCAFLTLKSLALLGWNLETGCCRGNLVTWTHEDGVPMSELMFFYKKRENRDIFPLTCEDIARRYWPVILGFTGPTSQTMRHCISLVAFGFSSQGRLIWSCWHPCPLVMWSPQCLSRSSYVSRGWKEQRNLDSVRLVPPALLSEESMIWTEHWIYLRLGKCNVFLKSALPRYRIGPTELGMRY